VKFTTWFAYFCGFIFLLVFGGMTGIALATVALDIHWQDTYFVVAHFHFIMVGAVIMAWLAGLHYWWPKMFGRMYPEGWGLVSAVLIILGFNATFIPQFLLGNAGMPRRYYSYPERFWPARRCSPSASSSSSSTSSSRCAGGRWRDRTRGARAATSGRRSRRRRPRTSSSSPPTRTRRTTTGSSPRARRR
jgi:Cytochrome C and Quinol oxidase polypeptide I